MSATGQATNSIQPAPEGGGVGGGPGQGGHGAGGWSHWVGVELEGKYVRARGAGHS
eukprot:COSAG02_NODE_49383_length_327_cov_0.684211_1_plen_55_part_01